MNKKVRMLVGVALVVLVMGVLFAQGFKADGGVGVYLTLEEALAKVEQDSDKFVQMEGNVINANTKYDSSKPLLVFDLTDGKNIIKVTFNDVKPDNFDSGYPVIVEGKFTGEKEFLAEKLKVKCPSKYEEEQATGEGSPPAK
ncbi:MAG: cytochrome c maturation protein CcmE [Clostridia bacterium]|nr:cytochrome c maturation protein CcmE [Clostridia bacterium]